MMKMAASILLPLRQMADVMIACRYPSCSSEKTQILPLTENQLKWILIASKYGAK